MLDTLLSFKVTAPLFGQIEIDNWRFCGDYKQLSSVTTNDYFLYWWLIFVEWAPWGHNFLQDELKGEVSSKHHKTVFETHIVQLNLK